MGFKNNNKVSLVGKTVLVTGSNTGIGYETALECAKRGARVIVACRNETKGLSAVETIINVSKNKNVLLKIIDLASLNSVRKFAKDIMENEERLDILINNAGSILLGDVLTEDGFQLEMQINYIAPVLLTVLLLDLVKKSIPSRIINVSSILAKYSKNFNQESMTSYTTNSNVYANSKLGNILFTQELADKLKDTNVSVFSVHPGLVNTDIAAQHLNLGAKSLTKCFGKVFLKNSIQGAQTTLYTALEQDIEYLTGRHFEDCKVVKPYKTARDSALSKQIWNITFELLKYDPKNI